MNLLGFPDYVITGNGAAIPFNIGTPDINGTFWVLDGEIGGWDSADGRVTMLTRIGNNPNADGEIPADLHYRGRSLTMTLYGAAQSETLREDSWALLQQATDLVDSSGTFYANEEIPKMVTIFRSGNNSQGKLSIQNMGFGQQDAISYGFSPDMLDVMGQTQYILKADIELYCQDPRKYAQTLSTAAFSGGVATCVNAGNTSTQALSFLLTATTGATTIDVTVNNGAGYNATLQLFVPSTPGPALSPFPSETIIDIYGGRVIDSVNNNYYYLRNLASAWLELPLGTSTVTLSGTSAGTVEWYNAWI